MKAEGNSYLVGGALVLGLLISMTLTRNNTSSLVMTAAQAVAATRGIANKDVTK